jgi:5'-deoxynucleotidase YfbR-like HD superfamily hydrolase
VAQHAYYCSLLGPEEEAFDRLSHDNAEAYIGDLNRPLKHYTEAGVAYRRQETVVQDVIAEALGFSKIEPPSVKLADNSMLYAEKAQLINTEVEEAESWERYDENNGITIEPWTPMEAEIMFLFRFNQLKRKGKKKK